jgi:hypothetical protein
MPVKHLSFGDRKFKFDARPDRIDLRDREYRPALRSLPREFPAKSFIDEHPDSYAAGLILDQGSEGACTGFGLAAVINYLLWKQRIDAGQPTVDLGPVSARMLYEMAKVYDEWAGEDYEGSSCRGAMKGWHKHGVCPDELWPYWTPGGRRSRARPKGGWQERAAEVPIGAYYRIDKDSIGDMQAAIREVGAIYVSSNVHDGWFRLPQGRELEIIPAKAPEDEEGGHAYAIVGYDEIGFIVQNSWGPDWGARGFALLPYQEWIETGADAWVAVLGAPIKLEEPPGRAFTSMSINDRAAGKAAWSWKAGKRGAARSYRQEEAKPWDGSRAYEHTVVMGNNGRPLRRLLDVVDTPDGVKEVVRDIPHAFLRRRARPRIAIYAHGGLNNEDKSIERIRVLGPYFAGNGVHPLFLTWRTGAIESLKGIFEDAAWRILVPTDRSRGLWDEIAKDWEDVKDRLGEAKDRTIEEFAERALVKSIWMQMKQNAAAAAEGSSGLGLVVDNLRKLKERLPALEIHLLGHSAGSILLGHLLDLMVKRPRVAVASLSLFAPACTMRFALDHYRRAVRAGILPRASILCRNLDDDRERADSVWKYGKSLLYLVSRALEDTHKMPLLGLSKAWDPRSKEEDLWHPARHVDLDEWAKFAGERVELIEHSKAADPVSTGVDDIPLAHGSFDNDVAVMTDAILRISGAEELDLEIENLQGF